MIHFPHHRRAKVKGFLPTFIKVINDLRKEKYDLIIDFQGLMRSAIFTSLSRSAKTIGFALPKESAARLAYSQKVNIPRECVHAVDRNLALAETVSGLKAPMEMPELAQAERFKEQITKMLKKHNISSEDKLMGVIPVSRWKSKCWPPDFRGSCAKIS